MFSVNSMNTIDKEVQTEYVVQKSHFITYLFKIYNEEEIKQKLETIKHVYKDATHYCYAYIIDTVKRFSDDGEPGGTAGIPILHVLEMHDCNHILAIVIRYFGGIKLGAGGLVRAYTKAVTDAFLQTKIKQEISSISLKIVFRYDNVKKIDFLLKNYFIVEKIFNENIIYIIQLPINDKDKVINCLQPSIISYTVLENNIYT